MSFWNNLLGGTNPDPRPAPAPPRRAPAAPASARPASAAAHHASSATATAPPPAQPAQPPVKCSTKRCFFCQTIYDIKGTACPQCGAAAAIDVPDLKPREAKADSVAAAVQLYNQGNLDGAIAECKRMIAANPGFAAALSSLGFFVRESGKTDEAVDHLLRALQLNPSLKEALGHLHDTITTLTEELCAIAMSDGFIAQSATPKHDADKRHLRARAIGAQLVKIGNSGLYHHGTEKLDAKQLLHKIASEVQVRLTFRPESMTLPNAWTGLP